MSILLVGLNHKTAPVELRERLAFSPAELPTALPMLVDGDTIAEGLVLSTCNRVEVVAATRSDVNRAVESVKTFLSRYHHLPVTTYDHALYRYIDRDAIRHLFRVASGLDSLVVGEPQILGQVKEAFAHAVRVGTVGPVLTRLLHRTFHVAKRIRTETGIGTSAVSVSSAAVELARKIFEDFRTTTVMLIGAGEMAELAVQHLVSDGVGHVLICNRTHECAQQMATRFQAEAVPLEELVQHLGRADILICSVSASAYVVRRDHILHAMEARRHRPLFLIDISVPRTVDPEVQAVENVFLYDIDDLSQVVRSNLERREREAARAEVIIDEAVTGFMKSLRSLEVGPLIAAFRHRLQDIAYGEFQRHRRRLGSLTPEQERVIKHMLDSIVNKVAHPAITKLHQIAREDPEGHDLAFLAFWDDAFRLGEKADSLLRREKDSAEP